MHEDTSHVLSSYVELISSEYALYDIECCLSIHVAGVMMKEKIELDEVVGLVMTDSWLASTAYLPEVQWPRTFLSSTLL